CNVALCVCQSLFDFCQLRHVILVQIGEEKHHLLRQIERVIAQILYRFRNVVFSVLGDSVILKCSHYRSLPSLVLRTMERMTTLPCPDSLMEKYMHLTGIIGILLCPGSL